MEWINKELWEVRITLKGYRNISFVPVKQPTTTRYIRFYTPTKLVDPDNPTGEKVNIPYSSIEEWSKMIADKVQELSHCVVTKRTISQTYTRSNAPDPELGKYIGNKAVFKWKTNYGKTIKTTIYGMEYTPHWLNPDAKTFNLNPALPNSITGFIDAMLNTPSEIKLSSSDGDTIVRCNRAERIS